MKIYVVFCGHGDGCTYHCTSYVDAFSDRTTAELLALELNQCATENTCFHVEERELRDSYTPEEERWYTMKWAT